MLTKRINKMVEIASFLLLFYGFTFIPQTCMADISVESFCQLSIQSMKMEVSNIQNLLAIINQYKDNPDTLVQQIEATRTLFDRARHELYSSFGTTADEYVYYMGKNAEEVNSYLKANPHIKQQIDDLSFQLNELMEQEESLMGSVGYPQPPAQ